RRRLQRQHGKLIPPSAVLAERLRQETRERSFEQTRARILSEQGFERQAESDFRELPPALRKAVQGLRRFGGRTLHEAPREWWPRVVSASAATIVGPGYPSSP